MIIVNFFGQPSSGKSTSAANTFAYLKNRACNLELIGEYAKQLVYSLRQKELSNQAYIFSKQYKKMSDVLNYGQVPMLITDSALLLGLLYCDDVFYKDELKALIWKIHNSFENVNVLVKRVKPYNPSGRNQTEAESDALIPKLESLGVEWDYVINGDENGQEEFAKTLLKKYGDRIRIKS